MTTVTEDAGSHDVPERLTVPEQLVRLAGRYAADGDVRRAQLASWAADVYVLEELLWENGLGRGAGPGRAARCRRRVRRLRPGGARGRRDRRGHAPGGGRGGPPGHDLDVRRVRARGAARAAPVTGPPRLPASPSR